MLMKLKSSIQLLEKVGITSFGRLQQQQLHRSQVTENLGKYISHECKTKHHGLLCKVRKDRLFMSRIDWELRKMVVPRCRACSQSCKQIQKGVFLSM